MDGAGFMDTMDPTLSELGDEFTLGDIDGKRPKQNRSRWDVTVNSDVVLFLNLRVWWCKHWRARFKCNVKSKVFCFDRPINVKFASSLQTCVLYCPLDSFFSSHFVSSQELFCVDIQSCAKVVDVTLAADVKTHKHDLITSQHLYSLHFIWIEFLNDFTLMCSFFCYHV